MDPIVTLFQALAEETRLGSQSSERLPQDTPKWPNTEERRENAMCKGCCERPEKLGDKPENCTPEQIRECHGDEKAHPCQGEKKE